MARPNIQYHVPLLPVEVDILDDWNSFLMSSQIRGGIDAEATMNHVKRFFRSFGFKTPRSVVNISETVLNKILENGEGYIPSGGFSLRLQTCCHQMVIMATELSKQGGRTGKSAGEQEGWSNNNGKPVEFSNNSMNFLKMMGPNPMAHMVMSTQNAMKVTPNMIPGIMQELAISWQSGISEDIGRLPMEFTPSTDVFSIFLTENKAAKLAGRQPLSYWRLTDEAFMPPWLPPEAVGGLVQFVKEDIMLAADD